MKNVTGRYFVQDEHTADAGEPPRFDQLAEARAFAKSLWESTGLKHPVTVRDAHSGGKPVVVFQPLTGEA